MDKPKMSLADIADSVTELDEEEAERYTLTNKGETALAEAYWRAKISKEIMDMDLSEGKQVSSDWYAGSLRTRMACAAVAAHGGKK